MILQLNIRSLLAHQQKLRQLLQILAKRNSSIDAVLLCETFLTKMTENLVNIPGYSHIGNYQKERKGECVYATEIWNLIQLKARFRSIHRMSNRISNNQNYR